MASDLKDFIRVYDDVLDSKICKNAIKSFEDNVEAHDRWENQFKPQFTQLKTWIGAITSSPVGETIADILFMTYPCMKILFPHF